MIVLLRSGATEDDVAALTERIRALGCSPIISSATERITIHIENIPGPEARESLKRLRSMAIVDQVIAVTKPFERVASTPANGINVDGLAFGGDSIVLMAGPCTVESEEQLFAAAQAVA